MFSYRHAFHAGNHADVLKHTVLIQLLDYLTQKEGPVMFVDSHAGAGIYSLEGGQAAKTAEYASGIAKVWDKKGLHAGLARYLSVVKAFNEGSRLRHYPGSPFIASEVLRADDRLRLFELHPSEGKMLEANAVELSTRGAQPVRGKRVMVERADGFAGMKALLPPPSRRGLVLIDPPYEDKTDYRKVRDVLDDALKRFVTGTYAVWYPVLQRMEARQLPDRLKRLPGKDWLNVSLTTKEVGPDGFGLAGSGMFIINPPWTLENELRELMPQLVELLAEGPGASFTLEAGVPVTGVGQRRGRPLE
jgi:23S rRNA (adenine2030-N6)-methyltransferase